MRRLIVKDGKEVYTWEPETAESSETTVVDTQEVAQAVVDEVVAVVEELMPIVEEAAPEPVVGPPDTEESEPVSQILEETNS